MVDSDVKKTIFKDIDMMIKKIKNCHSKTMYYNYCYELKALYLLCEILKIDDCPNIQDFSCKSYECDDHKAIEKCYNQLNNDRYYHYEFSKNVNNVDKYKKLNYQNFYLKNKKSLAGCTEYMIDFLKQYDIKLYQLFMELNNNNRIIGSDLYADDLLRTPAMTIASYGSFVPYIVIELENGIEDTINLVHELAHVYDYMHIKSKNVHYQKTINCLTEVPSYFLQFAYTDYLKKTKCFEEDIKNIYYGYSISYIKYIGKIRDELQHLSINMLDSSDIDEYLNYSYGIVIAYHFLERYLVNPEKTKKEIEKFILLDGRYNMMEMLEEFNLKEEIMDSKILKKYI